MKKLLDKHLETDKTKQKTSVLYLLTTNRSLEPLSHPITSIQKLKYPIQRYLVHF